jgi:hypothetical protein
MLTSFLEDFFCSFLLRVLMSSPPPPQRTILPTVNLRNRKGKTPLANNPSRVHRSSRRPGGKSEVEPIGQTIPQKRAAARGFQEQDPERFKRAKAGPDADNSDSLDLVASNGETTAEGTTGEGTFADGGNKFRFSWTCRQC